MLFLANGLIPAAVLGQLDGYTVFDLTGLGTLGGALLFLLVMDLVGYWVHRGLHNSPLGWRWAHQLHHSAERMDMAGAFYFHPVDFLVQQILPSIAVVTVFGVTPLAAAVGGFVGFFVGVSPHMNVRTPSWLGYVFQRPEMHAVHHTRGVHAYNYGVLAFSDLLFGTWRNPASYPEGDFGFWDGASAKLGAMLLGRDVAEPPRA